MMSIETSRSTTELSHRLNILQKVNLTFQTLYKNLKLLTQACRRCRLAMSVRQHRDILPLLCKRVYLVQQLIQRWQIDISQSLLQQKWSCSVIDILRSKTKVHKLTVLVQAQSLQFLLQEILHSLHVVVGDALNLLNVESIFHRELGVKLAQLIISRLGNTCQLWQWNLAQSDKILNLDTHTVANQSIL